MLATIEAVDVFPLRIPFARAQRGAKKSSVDIAVVRLRTNNGAIGIGETQAWQRQGSGEYLPNMVRVIRDLFVPRLLGRSPFETTAMAHLYASWPDDLPVGEFSNGPTDVLADDIVVEPMRLENGAITVFDRPGFGLELDEAKLKCYRADF